MGQQCGNDWPWIEWIKVRLVLRSTRVRCVTVDTGTGLYLEMNHSYPEHSWRHKDTVDWRQMEVYQIMSHWLCSFSWESPFLFLTFRIIRDGTSCIMQYRGIITKGRSKPSTTIMNYGVLKGLTRLSFVMGNFISFQAAERIRISQISHLEKASSKPSSISWKQKQIHVLKSSWANHEQDTNETFFPSTPCSEASQKK